MIESFLDLSRDMMQEVVQGLQVCTLKCKGLTVCFAEQGSPSKMGSSLKEIIRWY